MAYLRIASGTVNSRAYVHEWVTGLETAVNTTASGALGNGSVGAVEISRDGTHVVFRSNASNLTSPKPPSGSVQVYRKTVPAAGGPL